MTGDLVTMLTMVQVEQILTRVITTPSLSATVSINKQLYFHVSLVHLPLKNNHIMTVKYCMTWSDWFSWLVTPELWRLCWTMIVNMIVTPDH